MSEKRISGRTHSNDQAVSITRITKEGVEDRFYADFGPKQPSAVGHHTTEGAAQAEADQIMAANGHACSDACTPWTLITPELGTTKPCIVERCEGTMTWQAVRQPDAYFTKDGAELPERIPDYEAWVCSDCGFGQRGSN